MIGLFFSFFLLNVPGAFVVVVDIGLVVMTPCIIVDGGRIVVASIVEGILVVVVIMLQLVRLTAHVPSGHVTSVGLQVGSRKR